MILRKRRLLATPAEVKAYPMLRGFHAPQRDHVKQPMPKRASS